MMTVQTLNGDQCELRQIVESLPADGATILLAMLLRVARTFRAAWRKGEARQA